MHALARRPAISKALMALPQAIATVSRTPALATGLADRGALQPGLRADLIQVRMVQVGNGHHHPVVRAVWREGRRVL